MYLKTFTPERQMHKSGLRFLDPELGRWLSRDPVFELGFLNETLGSMHIAKIVLLLELSPEVRNLVLSHGVPGIGVVNTDPGSFPLWAGAMSGSSYAFVGNNSLTVYDPFGDLDWIDRIKRFLLELGKALCPGGAGEGAGAAECAPGAAAIAAWEQARREYQEALQSGDEDRIDRAWRELQRIQQRIEGDTNDCLKERCPPCKKKEEQDR